MNHSTTRTGIDCRGEVYYGARVDYSKGRPEIKALVRSDKASLGQQPLLLGDQLSLSVKQRDVICKELNLSELSNQKAQIVGRFEMIQSLLASESEFAYEILPSDDETGRHLGMMVRHTILEELKQSVYEPAVPEKGNCRFQARGTALGKGYIRFGRSVGSDFVCLVDFTDDEASICFLFKRHIIGITGWTVDRSALIATEAPIHLVAELKTVIGFRLDSLFANGVTVPLTRMLIGGEGISERLCSCLSDYFSLPVEKPELNRGFLGDRNQGESIPLENYLVALGLTVE